MIEFETNLRDSIVNSIADRMMIAARTAPKARGIDNLVICKIGKSDILEISTKMREMAKLGIAPSFFERDATNILVSSAIVVIATRISPLGLSHCSLCGHESCKEKKNYPKTPCHFNSLDLGIALGSAVSIACDSRIDNRIMRSIGAAVVELGLLGDDMMIAYGVPLSSTGKNPFFDRK